MAIANYGICVSCNELIENDSVMWRDIDGHSFSLVSEGTGFRHHVHTPILEENYKSLGKYDSLDAEILDSLAMHGYANESLGDQSSFGFFDFFPDYRAILISHPHGSVTVTRFDDDETMLRIWGDIEVDYANWDDDEPLYNEYGDGDYAYESGAYESDLWD